jgi:hypothetical protein
MYPTRRMLVNATYRLAREITVPLTLLLGTHRYYYFKRPTNCSVLQEGFLYLFDVEGMVYRANYQNGVCSGLNLMLEHAGRSSTREVHCYYRDPKQSTLEER